ncbi:MAG: M12 family metallo-peptidase [Phycisphaerales bacterium]
MRQSVLVAGAATLLSIAASSAFAVELPSPLARTIVIPQSVRAALADVNRAVDVPVEVEGRAVTLRIQPHSLRSSEFRLLVSRADGSLVEAPAPPPRTFSGTVLEAPGTIVRAAAVEGGLQATFALDGERWFVQPLGLDGTHAVYPDEGLESPAAHCGVADEPTPPASFGPPPEGGVAGALCSRTTELACDADYEFFQSNGSSVANTVADIENVLNGVEGIYTDQCDIAFVITQIVVRSDVNDPYTTNVAPDLLAQFADEWIVNQSSIPRDIAHLFTGKNLSGSTIGIAYTPGLCDPGAQYALSQSKWSLVYANRISVTSHEIGHNFSAVHCNGQPDCGIMCASIGGCALPITVFGATSAGLITSYADASSCLGPKGPTNVNASDGTTCGAVTVTFTSVLDAITQTVYRAVNSGNPANAVVVQTNATSPYVDSNIVLGTSYAYWVTATDTSGCESNLGTPDFGFAPTLVAAPTFVAATDGTQCGQVVIVWGSVSGASGYEIWRGTTSDSAQATFVADDNASPYSDTSAVPGQPYFYWVRSTNGCGDPGPFGASDAGSRKAAPAAAVPAASDNLCPGVTVTWGAVSGSTSYALWRGTSSDPAQASLLVANATSPTVDNSVVAGQTYWYFVQSFNTCGGGSLGTGDSGKTGGGQADLNGDCAVNGADLGILLGNWGGSGVGDFDGNGIVDGADLGVLLGAWTG